MLTGRAQAHLFYTLMIGDVPASALRQQADRDQNGRLDDAEAEALASTLRARVRAGVRLHGPEPAAALRWESHTLAMPQREVAAVPFSLELTATFPTPALAAAPVELRYEDDVALPPPGEVELRIEAAPAVRILATAIGSGPPALHEGFPQLVFLGEGREAGFADGRAVKIRHGAAAPTPPSRKPRSLPLVSLAVVLALLIGFALAWVAKRRQ